MIFLGYGRSPCALVSQRVNFPHTIYTNQNHKNHAGFSNFYNLEQKGLLFEEIRKSSTSFATGHRAQITPIRYIRIKIIEITHGEQKRTKKYKLIFLVLFFFIGYRSPMKKFFIGYRSPMKRFFIGGRPPTSLGTVPQ